MPLKNETVLFLTAVSSSEIIKKVNEALSNNGTLIGPIQLIRNEKDKTVLYTATIIENRK